MSSEEARNTVLSGLELKKKLRMEREAALEDQARQLRVTINNNHTTRTMTDAQRWENAQAERRARKKARKEKQDASMLAVQRYVQFCIASMLVTIMTPFPWWAMIALVAGVAVFPAAYIYRLEVEA